MQIKQETPTAGRPLGKRATLATMFAEQSGESRAPIAKNTGEHFDELQRLEVLEMVKRFHRLTIGLNPNMPIPAKGGIMVELIELNRIAGRLLERFHAGYEKAGAQ